jgi:hypothetical protein
MRRVVVLVLCGLVITAAGAFACTNISTLNISDSSGRPGSTVLITGTSFGNSSPTGRRTTTPLPVRIRWNGTEGVPLAEVLPDTAGNISASVTIPPQAAPGHYVIFAVQQDADGYHMYGTPARIAYEVLTPDGRPAPPAAASAEPTGPESGTSDLPVALVVLGVLGGALFVAGFAAFVRLLSPGAGAVPSRVPSE